MTDISYANINSLDEIGLIAGTDFILTFNVYDSNGNTIDISSGSAKWTLCPFGQPSYAALSKTGTISGTYNYQFSVALTTLDTKNLSGKYIQQPIIFDYSGEEYRPSQGVIIIAPRINYP